MENLEQSDIMMDDRSRSAPLDLRVLTFDRIGCADFVFAANSAYRDFTAVTILSLLDNLPGPVGIHVIQGDWSPADCDGLTQLVLECGSRLTFYESRIADFSGLPHLDHITLDTYSRVLAADLIPCDRFIYMDSDLLVESPRFLAYPPDFSVALSGVVQQNSPIACEFRGRWKLSDCGNYFNAGVLAINAALWREERLSAKLLEWMVENRELLPFADQDALNYYFWERAGFLHPSWNCEERHYFERDCGFSLPEAVNELLADPGIVHFTGKDKPWGSSRHLTFGSKWHSLASRVSKVTGWPERVFDRPGVGPFASFAYFRACARARVGNVRRKVFGG